jgi:hypothetical protein
MYYSAIEVNIELMYMITDLLSLCFASSLDQKRQKYVY